MKDQHSPAPWIADLDIQDHEGPIHVRDWRDTTVCSFWLDDSIPPGDTFNTRQRANALLVAAAPHMLAALREGRRAIGEHHAPNDCYATGPVTGDHFRDLVECPACEFIKLYDLAMQKARQE